MRELLADRTTDPSMKLFERYVRALLLFAVIRSNKEAKKVFKSAGAKLGRSLKD